MTSRPFEGLDGEVYRWTTVLMFTIMNLNLVGALFDFEAHLLDIGRLVSWIAKVVDLNYSLTINRCSINLSRPHS